MLIVLEILLHFFLIFSGGLWATILVQRRLLKPINQWEMLAIGGMTGILTVYLLFIATQSFRVCFYALLTTSLFALPFFKWNWQRITPTETLLLLLSAFVVMAILFVPLKDWDARSIWFFHAKILHFSQSLWSSDWQTPAFAFSHPHYPKLLPIITAYLTSPWTDWNAYLPKLSLLTLLVPAMASLLALNLTARSLFYIGITVLFLPGNLLWNGYMDGYVALYALLSALFLKPGPKQDSTSLLVFALVSSVLILLKQEGLAIYLSLVLAFIITTPSRKVLLQKRYWVFTIPLFLWLIHWSCKQQMGLEDYLLNNSQAPSLFISRLTEFSDLFLISKYFLKAMFDFILFLIVMILLQKKFWPRRAADYSFFYWAGWLYLALLFIVYAITPMDLQWHLQTSLSRVILPVKMLWITGLVAETKAEKL